jgi:hypothetical protein
VGALEGALAAVVARHEVLRTRLAEHGGDLVQLAGPVERVGLEELGWADERAAAELAAAFVDRPFDVWRGPLWRAGLIRLSESDRVLVLAADSLVCDARSLRMWVTELGVAYRELAAGRELPFAPLPVQYGDFARWQREAVAGDGFAAQIRYWRERLAGGVPLELPCDRRRPEQETGRGAAHAFVVAPAVHERLRRIAAAEKSTMFMVLLAAFEVLLARHSGQQEVAVGSLAPGRGLPRLASVIGLFENPMVLRAELSGDPSFREFLGRVRDVAIGAFSHQDVPFSVLFDALAKLDSPPLYPLFQVMFTLEGSLTPRALGRLAAVPFPLASSTSRWDLSLEMLENDQELQGILHYSTDLFDAATTRRLADRFVVLLDSISHDPGQPLHKLEPD